MIELAILAAVYPTIVVYMPDIVTATMAGSTIGGTRPTIIGSMPAIPRAGTAVITSTSSASNVGLIAATIIHPIQAKSIELRAKALPFGFRQLRLIDTFNPGPQLSFFPSDPYPNVTATKGDIPFCAVRRRHDARHLAKQILVGIAVQEEHPLLGLCQRHITELHFLHPWPCELRLNRLLQRLDIHRARASPRQRPADLDLPILNRRNSLSPDRTRHEGQSTHNPYCQLIHVKPFHGAPPSPVCFITKTLTGLPTTISV
jgi:hypothetical protein